MPRKVGKVELGFDEVHGEAYYSRPIVLRALDNEPVKFYNLKHRKPKAWEDDLCEIEIAGHRVLVRNQEVIQAMSLM